MVVEVLRVRMNGVRGVYDRKRPNPTVNAS
jgi:hypothetical protein